MSKKTPDKVPEIDLNNKETVVTLDILEKVMQGQQQVFSDALKKQAEQMEARLTQMASVLQQVVESVRKPREEQQQTTRVAEYSNSAQLLAHAVRELKQAFDGGSTSELDTISQLLAQSIQREVVSEGKRRVRKALRLGNLTEDEVEIAGVVLDEKIDRRLVHGPA